MESRRPPGIMVYFDLAEAILSMPIEIAGMFIKAMMEYGMRDTVPTFPDEYAVLSVIWPMVQNRIDKDRQNYYDKLISRQYAGYCSVCQRTGVEPVSRDIWMSMNQDGEIRK